MAFDRLKEDFERDGVAVLRGLIPPLDVQIMQALWGVIAKEPRKIGYNPVAVDGPFPDSANMIYRHPTLLDAVSEVFGPDIALYNFRFVVKDKYSRGPVFLHQDTGYHVGWPTKMSAFVALSWVDGKNGGMRYFLGTHRFGYLGDAGEIAGKMKFWDSYSPELQPGDVVLMHSACWHDSWPPHPNDERDRVLADCIFQPANDPSGIELLRGQWRCEPQPWLRGDNLFVRSRTSRLKEMQEKLREAGIE